MTDCRRVEDGDGVAEVVTAVVALPFVVVRVGYKLRQMHFEQTRVSETETEQ